MQQIILFIYLFIYLLIYKYIFIKLSLKSILFWFGDLNYRLNNNGDLIKEYISQGKIEDLLEFDQVNKSIPFFYNLVLL